MSKKKRLKKIAKSHANITKKNGDKLYSSAPDFTKYDKEAQLSALTSIKKLAAGARATALGIANPGDPLTEDLNIDGLITRIQGDVDDTDRRHGRDSDGDGISDNQEIVSLYSTMLLQLSTCESLVLDGGVVLADSATNRTNGNNNTSPGGDEVTYNAAEAAHDGNVTSIATINVAAAAQVAAAASCVTAIDGMALPTAGITLDGHDPRVVMQTGADSVKVLIDAEKSKIVVQKSTIDSREVEFENDPDF